MHTLAKQELPRPLSSCLLELVPQAATVSGNDGKILVVNERLAAWSGFQRTELISSPLGHLLTRESMRDDQAQGARSGAEGKSGENLGNGHLQCKNGERLAVQVSSHRVRHHGSDAELTLLQRNEPKNQSATWLDERQLETISETIGGLAHESRNALQRAVASLDLLELDLQNDARQMDLASKIRRSLSDLLGNYDEVRRFSEPIVLSRERTRLTPILLEAFERVRSRHRSARQRLRLVPSRVDDDQCLVDRVRMRQVFEHLLDNSMDQPGESILIRATCGSAWIEDRSAISLSISDDGIGFSPTAKSRGFEPFFTTKQHGTGLGLSISRRIIEAHGGTIAIGSPKRGAAMVILLPRGLAH